MATVLDTTYSTTGTAITITLASLGIGAARESAAVTNAVNLYVDALVGGNLRVGAIGADGTIDIYAYASADGGTTYSGGLIGTDETITWGTTPSTSSVNGLSQLTLIGVADVDTTDDNNEIQFGPYSIASAFGVLPEDWGLVIVNSTDTALHATQTNTTIHYSGIKYTSN